MRGLGGIGGWEGIGSWEEFQIHIDSLNKDTIMLAETGQIWKN